MFNDSRDPSTHIIQLKEKYALMRREMDAKISLLTEQKKGVLQTFNAVKSRYEVIKKVEKELFDKFNDLDFQNKKKIEELETELESLMNKRYELETENKLSENKVAREREENLKLELGLLYDEKLMQLEQMEFDKKHRLLLARVAEKSRQYEQVDGEIKELEKQQMEDPLFKIELEKNDSIKKKIKNIEREVIEVQDRVDELEAVNKFLLEKKEKCIEDRKRLYVLNDELKKEIENKSQVAEMRIQRRVKENNSMEIANLEEHTKEITDNIAAIREKIKDEEAKTRQFNLEIIKYTEELKEATKQREESTVN